ncbi:SDR family oxidoreductase [Schlegelella sp. S2-27]|uniref:SDR family oxidoreductase n=1 Tax=Caldimonas mangrovi TaxID=2944811 RepID=A0ABT0YWR7_9BURK|nr:SDR family oxidoreductase [Caldimonas mangrovi]MCM5682817.1 SDR family oxidoreductase [Caldimonas mangrovi]
MARIESRSNGQHDPNAVAARQRAIQQEQDQRDESSQPQGKSAKEEPPPTGTREQPRNPLPSQHLEKPGLEAEMELKPRFMAPDYKGSGKLQDMAALVTGGDSGIGRAVAVLYAREGADVAIAYLNEHEDAEETKRCVEAEGRRCILIPGDVKDTAYCKQAVEKTVKAFGKLDILVNNAAFQEHAQSLEDLSEERFDETLRTNVYGYFHMAKAALPHLKEGSSIINTGSVVGLRGSSHLLDYSTTKGAIHAFTKSLAQNVLSKGIRVNAVAPGPVWTPLNPADSPPEKIKDFGKQTDMKRAAQPEELSPAYVFLASPACSSYITGIVLPVTGSIGAI